MTHAPTAPADTSHTSCLADIAPAPSFCGRCRCGHFLSLAPPPAFDLTPIGVICCLWTSSGRLLYALRFPTKPRNRPRCGQQKVETDPSYNSRRQAPVSVIWYHTSNQAFKVLVPHTHLLCRRISCSPTNQLPGRWHIGFLFRLPYAGTPTLQAFTDSPSVRRSSKLAPHNHHHNYLHSIRVAVRL